MWRRRMSVVHETYRSNLIEGIKRDREISPAVTGDFDKYPECRLSHAGLCREFVR